MAEQPLIDISPEQWEIVRDILQRNVPDREEWAFGSRAKWTAKKFSDLDIAIIGDEPMSIRLMADLREAFQESALPFKIDIVDWAAITPSFRKVIETSNISLQVATSEDAQWQTEHLDDLCSLMADCPHSTPVWTAQVIEELIQMARSFNEAAQRGENLGLNIDEVAFYDALETNEASVRDLGDSVLKEIARQLTDFLRKNLTVDWSVRDTVRAKMRAQIKLILKRHKYPPDLEARAVELVLKQAEALSDAWMTA